MADPREAKLPKWAQNLLYEERRRSALSWPDQPRPTPLWEPGSNTYASLELDGQEVWQAIPSRDCPQAAKVDSLFVKSSGSDSGSRPEHGRFFATKREAWLDMWWSRAEEAATALLKMKMGADSTPTQEGGAG